MGIITFFVLALAPALVGLAIAIASTIYSNGKYVAVGLISFIILFIPTVILFAYVGASLFPEIIVK